MRDKQHSQTLAAAWKECSAQNVQIYRNQCWNTAIIKILYGHHASQKEKNNCV